MRIALIQFDIAWNNPEKNIETCTKIVNRAVEGGARLVILPEMFTTGCSNPTGEAALHAFKTGDSFLKEASQEHGVFICGSIPVLESASDKPSNSIRLYSPEGLAGEYAKIHLFSMDGEDREYLSGTSTLTRKIEDFSASFFICYDLRFPQIFSKVARETDIYVIPANWPANREYHWRSLLVARAIENQAFVVAVNRVGSGGGKRYPGSSMIISPMGEVLRRGSDKEELLLCDLDVEDVRKVRAALPFLEDRREELY
ncbi:MAG: carbon-nitrogen family hydrolase [Candidatus Dadabacteria bacterium]|nr:MAG: carbon-nitrogen family hydrolase [Candidatus Dadabacteria bacterium]